MSFRKVAEPNRATEQNALQASRRMKRLESHAFSGAIRSSTAASFTSAIDSTETALSLTLNPGRWAIFQRAILDATDVVSGAYATMTGVMRDTTVAPSTNPLFPAPAPRSTPDIRTIWKPDAAAVAATATLVDFGVHSIDEQSTLDLSLFVTGVGTATWTDLRLLAIPA